MGARRILGIYLGTFMISRHTLNGSHWWEFVHREYYNDIILDLGASNCERSAMPFFSNVKVIIATKPLWFDRKLYFCDMIEELWYILLLFMSLFPNKESIITRLWNVMLLNMTCNVDLDATLNPLSHCHQQVTGEKSPLYITIVRKVVWKQTIPKPGKPCHVK